MHRSFEAYEINTRSAHPSASHPNSASLAKRFIGVPLFENNDYTWSGNITIGTPGVTITG
jgi:hypothetical protein